MGVCPAVPPRTFFPDSHPSPRARLLALMSLGPISGLPQAYLRPTSSLSQACLKPISGLSQAYLRPISGSSQAYLRRARASTRSLLLPLSVLRACDDVDVAHLDRHRDTGREVVHRVPVLGIE